MKKPSERLKESLEIKNLWMYILKVLKERGEMHAYKISTVIEDKYGFSIGEVTSYVVLYKLAKQGFVKSKLDRSSARSKKNYTITKRGKEELKAGGSILSEMLGKLK